MPRAKGLEVFFCLFLFTGDFSMALTTNQAIAAQVSLAYFGRPQDTGALAIFGAGLVNGGPTAAQLATQFATAESKVVFGTTPTMSSVIAKSFELVGRVATAQNITDLATWATASNLSISQMPWEIMKIALVTESLLPQASQVAWARLSVAYQFSEDVSANATALQNLATSSASQDAARAIINTVVSFATISTAYNAAGTGSVAGFITSSATLGGSTFTLTTGIDAGTAFSGTSGNDLFIGTVTDAPAATDTFSAADTLNGGAGTDTLNIVVSGTNNANTVPAATVTSIENINVRALLTTVGTITSVTAGNFAGATAFNSDRSISALTVNGLAAGQSAGMIGNGAVANGALNANYANTVTAGVINVAGGTTAGVITETGTGITSNTINSTGAANVLTNVVLSGTSNVALTINAATNLTTGNITGFTGTTSTITVAGAAAIVNIGTLENTTVKTVNAAGLTAGGVTVTLNTNTAIVFTGGAGNDIVTAGAVLGTGASVDGGVGTADRLIFTADAQLTTVTAPFYKGFEVIQANTGVTIDVSQLAANNTITGVRVSDTAGAIVAINGLSATQAANVAIIAANDAAGAITLGLTGAANGGQIDTVKAALTTMTIAGVAQVSNLTGLTLVGVEKLELTGNGTTALNTGAVTLTTTNAVVLDSIILTNAGLNSITIAAGHTAANLNVNASGSTGVTTIDATAYNTTTGATLTGGSAADFISGSLRSDTIVGGAGNDTLFGDGSVPEVQTLTIVNNAGVGAGTIVIGGIATTTVGGTTIAAQVTAVLNNKATIIAANTTIADITTTGGGNITITYNKAAYDVTSIATSITGDANNGVAIAVVAATATNGVVANAASDTLTGGLGNDTFAFGRAIVAVATIDTITDLNLGSGVVGGRVDTIQISDPGVATAATIVTLSAAQQTTVSATANLSAAAAATLAVASASHNVAQFTYGADTYIVFNNDGNNTFNVANDQLIKITGATGTLDATDIVYIG
jgi:hypothetical protein